MNPEDEGDDQKVSTDVPAEPVTEDDLEDVTKSVPQTGVKYDGGPIPRK